VKDLEIYSVNPDATIREAIARIDRNASGIVLVLDEDRILLGTVTDGDIRRKILEGINIDSPITVLLEKSANLPYARPITVPEKTGSRAMKDLMRSRSIRHLPVVDKDGRVVDLIFLEDLLPVGPLPLKVVIMAGGKGTRLGALTQATPKSLLPVGDRPLLEHTINQLRQSGISNLNISTHYLADKIRDHFGDGSDFGVQINYLPEDQPLGTAGALGLMGEMLEPILVVNGDILTNVDYRAMLDYHREHDGDVTVGVRQYDIEVPFGVVESSGVLITGIREKPVQSFFVNAGIYLLQPEMGAYVEKGKPCEMPDLIQRLLEDGRTVVSFPVVEYWLDIGRPETYEKAQEDIKHGGSR